MTSLTPEGAATRTKPAYPSGTLRERRLNRNLTDFLVGFVTSLTPEGAATRTKPAYPSGTLRERRLNRDLTDFPVGDEGFLVMVLRLAADVISYLINLMATDCKCTVTSLPFENFSSLDFVGHQMGRAAFSFAD